MGLQDDIERLRNVAFLNVLDDEVLRLIAFNADHSSLDDGAILYHEGEAAAGSVFIVEGAVSLQMLVNGAMKERALLAAGTLIDPYALISEMRRPGTAYARGGVRLMLLDRKTFLRVMQNYPDLTEQIRHYIANDIDQTLASLNQVAGRLTLLDE